MDIDILLYDDIILHTDQLTIPHPLMCERKFVLEPLVEIAPELIHPITGKTFKEYL
jgi:2-amino-4-hydroxy-6-hydroxymethyldihydropteridine diphosphokinase